MQRCLRLVPLVAFLVPATAGAYELLGASWRTQNFPNGVPYCPVVNANDATTATLKTQFEAALVAAATSWSADGSLCSALEVWNAKGTATCTGTPSQDSPTPWVFWEDAWNTVPGVGPSTIGVTPWWSSGSQISQAKILFNDYHYDWTVSTSGVDTDVQSIATHEFGHFYGLDHYDEFSQAKRDQCTGSASYPAVMCAFYPGGLVRQLTADDVQGICYLYPNPGAIGSDCSIDGCDSGLQCHPTDGYCTKTCGTCPAGYTCQGAVCERNVPPPTCPACQDLPCVGEDTMCIGGSGSSFCTRDCSAASPCPDGYDCSPLEGGGAICWPMSNSCNADGPGKGEACGSDYVCAFGNICLSDGQNTRHCYSLCETGEDCAEGEACQDLGEGTKYCDEEFTCPQCGTLPCGEDPTLLNIDGGCMCTPDCTDDFDCPVGFWCVPLDDGSNVCYPTGGSCKTSGVPGAGQACTAADICRLGTVCLSDQCYTACRQNGDCPEDMTCQPTNVESLGYCDEGGGCSCDDSATCDAGCTCDPDCDEGCTCDTASGACSAGCACDPDCNACACDDTAGCDAGCACDNDCGCACDETSSCDNGCECDPECGFECACNDNRTCEEGCDCDPDCPCTCDTTLGCEDPEAGGQVCTCDPECLKKACTCDKTTACDADCDHCDPECPEDGCFSAAVRPNGGMGTLLGVSFGLSLLFLRTRRRR